MIEYVYICIHNVYGVHIIDTSISEYMVIYVGMYICVCDSNVVCSLYDKVVMIK